MLRTPAWVQTIDALPPGLRYRLSELLGAMPAAGGEFEGAARARLDRLLIEGEPWLGAEPDLAELGYWMIEPGRAEALRQRGCLWLARFPSVETAQRLARLALDAATPAPVKDQAIRSLGARQRRAIHPATQWSSEAVQLADEALIRIASEVTDRTKIASPALCHALRHVASDGLAAVFARAPGLWGDALEWFATPPLARVLAVSLDDIAPPHRVRALRLIAATLGDEAIGVLQARLPRAAIAEQLEMLQLAVGLGGEAELGRLEDAIRGAKFAEHLRGRARWHLAHRGVVPTVRGLRVARTTAVYSAAECAARCPQAADDLAALTRYERHTEPYLYELWGWMVRGAGDPARARVLVAAHPGSRALVGDLYLEDLARRGRVAQLVGAARALGAADRGALWLAIWGRPLAALELAAAARDHTPELVCARALACYRAGRPDLTARILAEDLPPAQRVDRAALAAFPGPHERWMIERAPALRPALAALAAGPSASAALAAVAALAQPAPHGAEPDRASLAGLAPVIRRLDRPPRDRTVAEGHQAL